MCTWFGIISKSKKKNLNSINIKYEPFKKKPFILNTPIIMSIFRSPTHIPYIFLYSPHTDKSKNVRYCMNIESKLMKQRLKYFNTQNGYPSFF